MIRIVFFGTPAYVEPVVQKLHRHFLTKSGESPIAAVVTQKPKPTGRKQTLSYSAVDTWAHKKGIPIYFEPQDIIDNTVQADLGVLASFGKIIPQAVLDYFPHGILNIHPSLLPEFRGASPVQATLISGANQTSVSIIKLDRQLDHGPIISQFKEGVEVDDTTQTLRERLFARSAEVLTTLIPAYLAGKINLKAQDHSKATFTRQIKKTDAFIPPKYLQAALRGSPLKANWEIPFITTGESAYSQKPTVQNLNSFIRAMQPWPVAWTLVKLSPKDKEIKRLKILKSTIKDRSLTIEDVQLEGKNPVSWQQFIQGYPEVRFD